MSKFIVDDITRSALWTAYGNTCYYCDRFLEWNQLHIDHILPERLLGSPNELIAFIKDYELEEHFEINSIYNFLPSHSNCNMGKGGKILAKGAMLYMLDTARKKSKVVLEEIIKETKRRRASISLAKISTSLAGETFTVEDVKNVLEQAQDAVWYREPVQIVGGFGFIDEMYDKLGKGDDLNVLYNKSFLTEEQGSMIPFTISVTNGSEEVEVGTLAELVKYNQQGYYAFSTLTIAASTALMSIERMIRMLKNMKRPRISYLDEISISNPAILSPLLLSAGPNPEAPSPDSLSLQGKSLADLVADGEVEFIETNTPNTLLIHYWGFSYYFIEVFRGDLNDDGIEDIFVDVFIMAIEGTMKFSTHLILTRYSNKHLIEPSRF